MLSEHSAFRKPPWAVWDLEMKPGWKYASNSPRKQAAAPAHRNRLRRKQIQP